MKKLQTKFSALNVDFYGLNLDFLYLRKPAHEDMFTTWLFLTTEWQLQDNLNDQFL